MRAPWLADFMGMYFPTSPSAHLTIHSDKELRWIGRRNTTVRNFVVQKEQFEINVSLLDRATLLNAACFKCIRVR